MTHPTSAELWVGEEEEAEEGIKTLFVDGASKEDILSALDDHPDVKELYFGHEFDPDVVEWFENRIDVTLEVSHPEDVPPQLRGLVNVVLRVPNWVTVVKQRDDRFIETARMDGSNYEVCWGGKKTFENDEVVQ